jgi:uncharacterized protein HemY
MLFNLIKFAIYLIIFGAIFYLIHLYDRDLILFWGEYEIEISTVFLCFGLLIFLVLLLKVAGLILRIFTLQSRLQKFLIHRKDINNLKLLLEGYGFLFEGKVDKAIKAKNQLSISIKKDPLFEPFRGEYEKFSKLCTQQEKIKP